MKLFSNTEFQQNELVCRKQEPCLLLLASESLSDVTAYTLSHQIIHEYGQATFPMRDE